ncbi:nicotinamide mononucleotide transporter [bacterium A37T11]|nr:nicotinamide mononucleotide transporter [bacterium A37T11]
MPFADLYHNLVSQFEETTLLEWFGTLTGFLCVYLAAKQHILNWPISILSVVAYILLFYQNKLYGDSVLQLYFLVTAIYGWYYWLKRKEQDEKPVVRFSSQAMVITITVTMLLAVLIGYFLYKFTDSDVPYIDGTCTAISFIGQLLMTRKVLQNWLLWMLVDIAYIPLYIYKGLSLTAILYAAFTIIALIGYRDWRRSWKTNN